MRAASDGEAFAQSIDKLEGGVPLDDLGGNGSIGLITGQLRVGGILMDKLFGTGLGVIGDGQFRNAVADEGVGTGVFAGGSVDKE